MSDIPPPPPGFTLDAPASIPPPPAGFTLDAPQAQAKIPPPPPGFTLDAAPQGMPAAASPAQAVPATAPVAKPSLEQYINQQPLATRLAAKMTTGTLPGGNVNPLNWMAPAAGAIAQAPVAGAALQVAAQPMQGTIGRISPNAGQYGQQQVQQAYGNPGGVGGLVGRAIGGAANVPYMLAPGGRAFLAAAASGNAAIDIANRRQAGENIGTAEATARETGAAAFDWATNKALNVFGQKIFGSMGPAAGATAQQIVGQYAKKFGKDAVTNEVITHAGIAGQNLIAGHPLTEGMGKQSIADALVQTVGQGVAHEAGQAAEGKPTILSKMRQNVAEKAAAPQVPPEAAKPPVMPEAVQVPKTPEKAPAALAAAVPAAPEAHPARIESIDALTDYYKQHNPNDTTGDILKTMAPHTPYVKAKVPMDFAQGVGEDVDQAKVADLGKLTTEERQARGPAILGPNGDIFDGAHRIAAAKEAGDTHVSAYVPEGVVGQHGIEAAGGETATPPPEGKVNPLIEVAHQKMEQNALAEAQIAPTEGERRAMESFSKRQEEAEAIPQQPTIEQKPEQATTEQKPVATEKEQTPFQQRTTANALREGLTKKTLGAKETLAHVNRVLGTGLMQGTPEKQFTSRMRESMADLERSKTVAEQAVKPFRDEMDKWDKDRQSRWVNNIDQGKPSGETAMAPAEKLALDRNRQLIKRGDTVGMDVGEYKVDHVGRLAEWPDSKGHWSNTSLGGAAHFLRGRVYDTHAEFEKAVQETGGRLVYQNPMDMMLAKQHEMEKYVNAKELLHAEQTQYNTVKKVPIGTEAPEGWKKIDDRIAKEKGGALYAEPGIADKINQHIAPGVPSHSLWDTIIKGKRAATAINFGMSAYHLGTETIGNALFHSGLASENLIHGELGLAAKNVGRAMNPLNFMRGLPILEQYAKPGSHPELEPFVKAAMKGGDVPGVPSILDRTAFQKSKAAYDRGDNTAGRLQLLHGLAKSSSDLIMKKYVPAMKAAALASDAETRFSRGEATDSPKAREHASKLNDVVNHVMGDVNRSNQFQHKAVQAVEDMLFSAPKFAEGSARLAGATGRDAIEGLRDLAQGKKPTYTPALRTAVGYLVTHAMVNAIGQVVATSIHNRGAPTMPTGKDFWAMRTGRKNKDGTDERYEFPDPVGLIPSMIAQGSVTKPIVNRVAPIWRAVSDLIQNKDYKNVQVREGGVGKQTVQSIEHLGKAVTPFSVESQLQQSGNQETPTVPERIAQAFGMKHANADLSRSPAEQAAVDALRGRNDEPMTHEQEAKNESTRDLRDEVRTKNPSAAKDISQAVKEGKITSKDAKGIFKKGNEPTGLPGLVKELDSRDLMEKVWPKMTPQERQDNQWAIRGKIGQANLPGDEKRKYWDQIKKDTVKP